MPARALITPPPAPLLNASGVERLELYVFACRHDINWLKRVVPDDPPAVRVVDCPRDERHGCHDEALGYLQFIASNYDALPRRILFLHGHEVSHHYDEPVPTQLSKLLPTRYFATQSFGGVYCHTNDHFAPAGHVPSAHMDPAALWSSECEPSRYALCQTHTHAASAHTARAILFLGVPRSDV